MHISQKALGIIFAASPLTVALVSPLAGWACSKAGSFHILNCSVLSLVLVNAQAEKESTPISRDLKKSAF